MMWRKYRIELGLVLAGIGVLAGFAAVQRMLLGHVISSELSFLGVPLDDVYIHTRFAENLLHGYSYSFNPGQTLTADTSPLWVLLIAIGGIFTSHLELVAIWLSMLAYLAIGPGVYRAARDVFALTESHARVAGIAAVVSSRLAWSGMSGMETALAALLMLLAMEEHTRARAFECPRWKEALWLGLGILVRPEFMFVAGVLILDWAILAIRQGEDSQVRAWAKVPLLLFVSIASPAFLLPLITRNSLISHSSVVQGAAISMAPNLRYLWFAIKILASNNVIIFALVAAGLWLLRRERKYYPLFIIAIGLPVVQAFVAPQFRQSGRYFFPVIPLLIILAIAAWKMMGQIGRMGRMVAVLIVLSGIIETARWAMIAGESVRNINDQHLAVVGWLRQNTQPSDTLAVDDVGAIGYFLNTPVIDLTGLMTPEIWPLQHDQDSVWRTAREMGANLFVIYRRLNPTFYEAHKDSLVFQQDFRVRLPLASSADTVMSIYRLKGRNGP
ncbi:MAG TPA: hypothetical protein VFD13_05515 [Candidatus Kapabacteria bacterium]|nr:hypothetical protein [Candidatus Kapabacteria bacterium]